MKNITTVLTGLRAVALLVACFVFAIPGRAALVAAWGENLYGENRIPALIGNVKSVAAGEHHNLALRSDGTVAAWGRSDNGILNIPAGLANVKSLAAGSLHSVALRVDGTVAVWGNNSFGQTNVPGGLSGVSAVAAGSSHNLALKSGGTVVAWGRNGSGETNVPADLSDVIAIAAGANHNLALKADGSVVAWGYNHSGQTSVPSDLSNVLAIAAGVNFSVALKVDGTVVAWGDNHYGQTNVPAGLLDVTAITAGYAYALALKSDGTVVAWGSNISGGTTLPPGMSNVTAIAAGGSHGLALVQSGPVQLLQQPVSQETPYTSNATFNVVANGYEPLSYQWYVNGVIINPSNVRFTGMTSTTLTLTNAQFSDIGTYTVVVSNAFGSVVSTGAVQTVISPPFFTSTSATNLTVPAGTSLTLSGSASGTPQLAYQWMLNGTNLPGRTTSFLSLVNVQPVSSGIYSLLVTNLYGSTQADFSLTVSDSAPYIVQQPFVRQPDQSITTNPGVPLGGNVTLQLDARGSTPLTYQWRFQGTDIPGGTNSTLLLTNMTYGQMGFYSVEVRNAFGEVISTKLFVNVVQVYVWDSRGVPATNTPPGLTNVVSVVAGSSHVLALKNDGRVVAWGGSPAFLPSVITNVPSSVTNVAAIAAGGDCSMALRSNGTVVAWGLSSLQTNVPAGATNIMAIAAGDLHCLALRSNGTVMAWGDQSSGKTAIPIGLSNVVAVAAGSTFSVALKSDGRMVAWGGLTAATTNLVAGLSNAIAIDAAASICVVMRENGTVVSWQNNGAAILSRVSNVVAVAAGQVSHVSLMADGGVATWFNDITPNSVGVSNVIAIASGKKNSFGVAVIGDGSPAFTVHPASQLVTRSNTVRLHARTAGLLPTRYQWQFNGVNILNATNTSLTVSNIQGAQIGAYRCVATNSRGTNTSNPALLSFPPFNGTLPQALNATNLPWTTNFSIGGPLLPPWFPQNRETHGDEAAGQSGVTTNGGQSILGTTITGPGTLTFWWKVSSEEGYDYLNFHFDNLTTPLHRISGEAGWLQVTQVVAAGTHTLRWVYSKDVTVSAGRDAGWLDEVVFTPDPPVIVRHPFDATATAGATVTIPAIASGSRPLTYQWLKNGTNLPGATAEYLTLTNVTRRHSGSFALRVSNAGGSVTSSNATLRVLVPQQMGSIERGDDGAIEIISGDSDGGQLLPQDLPVFDAQTSDDLVNWNVLPGALSVTNGALLLRDPEGAIHPQRFYRIVER